MSETNPNSRLETFCDGVFGIALTLLIIDIKIPETVPIHTTAEFWSALFHILPSIFAFLLSFCIILIAWHNHHNTLKLVDKSSPAFIYANGFLLLTVVILPFPTNLLGEHLFTSHAVPAVVSFSLVNTLQPIGWILIGKAALNAKNPLTKCEKTATVMAQVMKNGFFALIFNSIFTIAAFWFPVAVTIAITLTWIFWLVYGITIKEE